jgi:hypothetical protein
LIDDASTAKSPRRHITDYATEDPCCGTGILLMEAGKISPNSELVGQDIDPRCAKNTAINLGLRGRYGRVVCGNSLTGETQFAYRIGSFFNETPDGLRLDVIRDFVPPHLLPGNVERTTVAKQTAPRPVGDLDLDIELLVFVVVIKTRIQP